MGSEKGPPDDGAAAPGGNRSDDAKTIDAVSGEDEPTGPSEEATLDSATSKDDATLVGGLPEKADDAAVAGGGDRTIDTSAGGGAAGDNATVVTGTGDATVVADSGDATVVTGDGDATVVTGAEGEEAAAAPPGPGETPAAIGGYPIRKELGRGGMGVVYLAEDPKLERPIALKVLPERLAAHPVAFSRFQGEAKLLASMNHPNIATIHSLEEDEGAHFLTMELIKGEALSDRIAEKPLSTDEWLPICRQISVALEAAHKNGIVHLDLKPGNIMVTGEGLTKVLDFGIAMALGTEESPGGEVRTKARTQDGVSGTPGYMSPEQLQNEAIDSRADIWAFGCILFECITGRAAFPGPTLTDRMSATLNTTPDLELLPNDTPPRIRELLHLCLQRDADKRLGTITKIRQALEEEIALRALPEVEVRRETIPNNLPGQLSSFVGRQKQKSEVQELLGENRLVTLTGVGGGGKTRLSIEVGRELLPQAPDGVWLTGLAPVVDPELVPQSVTTVLGLRDEGSKPVVQLLVDHLKEKSAILILDNCEHLIESVSNLVSTLLSTCRNLRVLATSREPLGVAGELAYQVPSMSVPQAHRSASLADLAQAESVQLFTLRAAQVNRSFELTKDNAPAVTQICRRLDGIPLAIELAAARIKMLPPEEIAKRLDNRFRVLGSSRAALPHHKTLRALIDWSYDHLEENEQSLLRRLSLFAGGWTLDAAETVCAGEGIEDWEVLDLLSSLVDKSLVETDAEAGQETGRARYRMLETIREYSREKMRELDEGAEILTRHRDYFLALAEESEPQLTGPEQPKCMARLASEHDNLRLALDVSSVPTADPEVGWRLAGALGRYFYIRGLWNEGRSVYDAVLDREGVSRTTAPAANALNWAGNLAKLQSNYPTAKAYYEESLAIRRKIGDQEGVAASLSNLGVLAKDLGEYDEARRLCEEASDLHKQMNDKAGVSRCLNSLGVIAYLQADYESSAKFHEGSLGLRKELGDRWGVASSLVNLAEVARVLGDYDKAESCLKESLAIQKELGVSAEITGGIHNTLGRLAEERGDLIRAREEYDQALEVYRELGEKKVIAATLNNLGMISASNGDLDLAREYLSESLTILAELEDGLMIAQLLHSFAVLEVEMDHKERAARLLGAAEALLEGQSSRQEATQHTKFEPVIQALREDLGEEAFRSEWAGGRALNPLEAIQFALQV